MQQRTTIRETRKQLSKTLNSGKAISIGSKYGQCRGFLVGVVIHNHYDRKEKKAALARARAEFVAAWIEESKQ